MSREQLDRAMRQALVDLAVCSHARTSRYEPRGRSGATESVDLVGGDVGPAVFERMYGPPFHDPAASGRVAGEARERASRLGFAAPARTDHERRLVVRAAVAEVQHLRGRLDRPRPVGESVAERNQRLIDEGEGLSAAEAAFRFRLEGGERQARRIRLEHARYPEDGTPAAKDLTTDQKRDRAREMRARSVPTRDIAQALGVGQTQVMRWTRDMGKAA